MNIKLKYVYLEKDSDILVLVYISLITLLNKKAIVLSDETGRELKREKGKRWI